MANSKISALPSATTPLAGTETLPVVQSSATRQVSVANLTAGRSVSGTSFVPTGSTIPANGLYLAAANSVGFATNSTNAIYIDSTQQVGVGTTSVTNPQGWSKVLQVTGSGSAGVYVNDGTNNWSIAAYGTQLWITNGLTTSAKIDASGNLLLSTGNLVPSTAAKGVNFTANTPAAGMTSQLLNWYEEGTWTATLGPGVIVNSGVWAATATYTRIGRTVFWNVAQTGGNISVSAGLDIFSGLPFAPAYGAACAYTNTAVNLVGVGLAETNSKVYVAAAITSQTALRFSGTYQV